MCGREPKTATEKSQDCQEVAHGRNIRAQEKLLLESLNTWRETGVKSPVVGFFYVSPLGDG